MKIEFTIPFGHVDEHNTLILPEIIDVPSSGLLLFGLDPHNIVGSFTSKVNEEGVNVSARIFDNKMGRSISKKIISGIRFEFPFSY